MTLPLLHPDSLIISNTSSRLFILLELELTITTEMWSVPSKPSCQLPEQSCFMLRFTGQRLPMPSFGPWQLSMLSFCTIISLTHALDCHPMTCSLGPIGHTVSSTTFMCGAALYMCWIKQFKMVRKFHVGIHDWNIMFKWVSQNNMQAAYLWSSVCQLEPSHPSFTLSLMTGLPPLPPASMIFLTSTVPTGPSSLVNLTISTPLMMMKFTNGDGRSRSHCYYFQCQSCCPS